MFSKNMNEAIQMTQKFLDVCCSSGSVSLVALDNIKIMGEFVEALDPTYLYQAKGILNKIAVKAYWSKYNKKYDDMCRIIERLKANQLVLSNTLKTLNNMQAMYTENYNIFLHEVEESNGNDIDIAQQALVAENMYNLLNNTINEYIALANSIAKILQVSSTVFNTAVLQAKMQTQGYLKDYCKLKECFKNM